MPLDDKYPNTEKLEEHVQHNINNIQQIVGYKMTPAFYNDVKNLSPEDLNNRMKDFVQKMPPGEDTKLATSLAESTKNLNKLINGDSEEIKLFCDNEKCNPKQVEEIKSFTKKLIEQQENSNKNIAGNSRSRRNNDNDSQCGIM